MIVKQLTLRNFMGYRDECFLDFTDKPIIAIAGHNEAGKSSILQSISYALYGKTRATSELQLINDQADTLMFVTCVLEFDDGSLFSITRGRTLNNEPVLRASGIPETSKPSVVEAYIQSRIKLDYIDFVSLFYFQQGEIHQFLTSNKRDYFKRWTLPLQLWTTLEAGAKEKIKDVKAAQAELELQHKAALRIRNQEAAILAEHQRAVLEVERCKVRVSDSLRTLQDAKLVLQDYQTQRSAVEKQGELKRKLKDAEDRLSSMDGFIQTFAGQIRAKRAQLEEIQKGLCPLLKIECSDLQGHQEAQVTVLEEAIKSDRLRLHKLKTQDLPAAQIAIDVVQSDLSKLGDLAEIQAFIQKSLVEVQQAERLVGKANTDLQTATLEQGEAQLKVATLHSAQELLVSLRTSQGQTETLLRRWQYIAYLCGKNGIPSLIIEKELEGVEAQCNDVLERLDYPKRMRFSAYKDLIKWEKHCLVCNESTWMDQKCTQCGTPRAKERTQELTIQILDGAVKRAFELESGGAQVLQSFAVRLACSLFLSNMLGTSFRMIMLDETFAMLDQANRQKLLGLVMEKLHAFGIKQQFVISHNEDVLFGLGSTLFVTRERGSAIAKWI